jgi:hypothetical protein
MCIGPCLELAVERSFDHEDDNIFAIGNFDVDGIFDDLFAPPRTPEALRYTAQPGTPVGQLFAPRPADDHDNDDLGPIDDNDDLASNHERVARVWTRQLILGQYTWIPIALSEFQRRVRRRLV